MKPRNVKTLYQKDETMPKFSLDPQSNTVVENPNFKEPPIKARRYTAEDVPAWNDPSWKEVETKPSGFNESMPWTQAEYENWPGDIKDLYAKYNVPFYGKPMTDKQMFDQQPDDESIHAAADRTKPGASCPDYPAPLPTDIKFHEDRYLDEIKDYIAKTYGEHYSNGEIQAFELIASTGNGDGFAIGNILKLASRYGKKEGYNRKDILKIIHYALLELWVHDNATRK